MTAASDCLFLKCYPPSVSNLSFLRCFWFFLHLRFLPLPLFSVLSVLTFADMSSTGSMSREAYLGVGIPFLALCGACVAVRCTMAVYYRRKLGVDDCMGPVRDLRDEFVAYIDSSPRSFFDRSRFHYRGFGHE